MEEQFSVIDSCLMIRMPEEIDHYKSAYICENADKYILRKDVNHIVFDFSDTKFMDALLSNRDGYLLELTGWTQGSQAS